tara:strand:+ start:18140 stop:18721 length:582 start_codon:yes stop_codon:yes gene_type:complete
MNTESPEIKDHLLRYVFSYKIADHVCDQIVAELKESTWEPHRWYNSKENYYYTNKHDPFESYLNSSSVDELRDVIWDSLMQYGRVNSPHKKDYIVKYSHPKFNRYKVDQRMDVHVDHTKSLFGADENGNRGIPVMSIVGCLNDDFEGGEFLMRNIHLPMKKGHMIVFPSLFLFDHEVKPVTSGTRYSFVTWAW